MARLTEAEKQQLLEATRDRRPDAGAAWEPGGAQEDLATRVAMAVYFRQLKAVAQLPRKPKPVAFEGAYWRL